MIFIALLFNVVVGETILKNLIMRERPYIDYPAIALLISEPGGYSFPSGHTFSSFAAATAISRSVKFYGRTAVFLLAFCIGLNQEARLIKKFLAKDFEVVSICCKNCAIAKERLNLKKVNPQNKAESMCNPKYQAQFLNEAGCELFISCGLCVGHDAIFNKNCQGPVTTLVAKDRVLAHNPLGAVYSRYWKKKLNLMEKGEI